MKKISLLLLQLCFVAGISAQITTPQPSPGCKIEQKVGLTTISIDYSRPSMKDRVIFGDLVSYDKMWRTGANQCTKITFGDDVMFDDKKVTKGTYALLSVPGKDMWEIILYADTNFGGVPNPYDAAKEVARVKAEPELLTSTVETFAINFNNLRDNSVTMELTWENTIVSVEIGMDVDSKVMKNIETVLAGPSAGDYYNAARYFYNNNKDMNKALEYANKANTMNPTFWQLRMESLILARLGRNQEAIAKAKESLAKAIDAKNDDYIKMNEDSIAEWSAK